MIVYFLLFLLSVLAFFYFRSSITQEHFRRREKSKQEHAKLVERYEELLLEQQEINREISELDQHITRMQYGYEGESASHSPSPSDQDESVEEALSSHMISTGLLSLEQYQKAKHTMQTMKLDLLGTCLALGFITESAVRELKTQFPSASHR